MIELSSTNKIKTNINVLVYGEAGVGKTVLCSTAPKPLIVSSEKGLLSLIDKDIPVIEIRTKKDCEDVYVWLTSSKEAKEFATVCFDSISEIAEIVLNDCLKKHKDGRQAYGEMGLLMSNLIRSYRDLDNNVYFTAKVRKLESDVGVSSICPSVPGQTLLGNLPYFFDEVFKYDYGRTSDGTTFRALYTQGDVKYVAKDRSGKLNPIEKPDLSYIFDKIKQAVPAKPKLKLKRK